MPWWRLPMHLEHRYGKNVHILNDPYLSTILGRLCSPDTFQPLINQYVEMLYRDLLKVVVNREFPKKHIEMATRMTAHHPDQLLRQDVVDDQQKAVSVNLARAGTFPSHICYNTLNYILNPAQVRQDHILAARTTDQKNHVTGAAFGGTKIGGDIDNSIVLFPDPMGATGSTIVSALDHYKSEVKGTAFKFVSLHLIVTPEYLRRTLTSHPDLIIYTVRLDRGLSPRHALDSIPGTYWNEERGLNDKQYIVPGGGGFGEILNNSFV